MIEMFQLAGKIAMPNKIKDMRQFWLGCVGIRKDGVKVVSQNGAVISSSFNNYQLLPNSHAEGRVIRKMGRGGTLYVARISKNNKTFTMSRPCPICQVRIRSTMINRVYYTINEEYYGLWLPLKDEDKIFKF